ncbi:endonuclease domain-containing protein [Novosphingobium bradum]|uniref:Endonuclease domain-containing protein n=1 Tax=Novosphingobium bradum TaxID=1737444 RepID=A0ABV7IVW1_9SPHN
MTRIARKLRREPTLAESRLWERIKGSQLGVRFTRQCPIGPYVVDFACRSKRLAIEVDGGQHADSATDASRTRLIEAHGCRVIRFWNNDVLSNVDGVLFAIAQELALASNRSDWFERDEFPEIPERGTPLKS